MLADLAEHVELQRVPLVGLVVDMLEFYYEPALQTTSVDVSRATTASAGGHILESVILLLVGAESALDFESCASAVEMLMVDEPPIGHQF